MNSKKTTILSQALHGIYGFVYGSIMGLGIGTMISAGMLGAFWGLTWIIKTVAFPD